MLLKRNIADEPGRPVAMDGVKDVDMRIMVGRADGAPNFALRHFRVAPGGHTPRHSHDYEHEVVVVGGRGTAEYEGGQYELGEGDVLLIEPNRVHQFRADRGAELRFLCLVPISFDCGKPTPGS
jgi:quercetin dioxygenase-like cupin family protein